MRCNAIETVSQKTCPFSDFGRCRRRPCACVVCCCPSSRSAGTSHVHAGAGGADCLTLDRSAFNRLFGQTVLDEVANANEKVLKTASKVYGNNTTTTKLRLSFFSFFFFFLLFFCDAMIG